MVANQAQYLNTTKNHLDQRTTSFQGSGLLFRLTNRLVKLVTTPKPVTAVDFDAERRLIYFSDDSDLYRMPLEPIIKHYSNSVVLDGSKYAERVVKSGGKCSALMIKRYFARRFKYSCILFWIALGKIVSIAYDWITGNVYYASSEGLGHLGVCSNNHHCAQILKGPVSSVLLDPVGG